MRADVRACVCVCLCSELATETGFAWIIACLINNIDKFANNKAPCLGTHNLLTFLLNQYFTYILRAAEVQASDDKPETQPTDGAVCVLPTRCYLAKSY